MLIFKSSNILVGSIFLCSLVVYLGVESNSNETWYEICFSLKRDSEFRYSRFQAYCELDAYNNSPL